LLDAKVFRCWFIYHAIPAPDSRHHLLQNLSLSVNRITDLGFLVSHDLFESLLFFQLWCSTSSFGSFPVIC
jgi:hypothetical protein